METHLKITHIDAQAFKKALIAGTNALVTKRDEINAMNVFPVPDGDTGTNMSLTFMAAAKEARSVILQNVSDVAKAASSGALRGARGNSGVILSQLFRGFSRGLGSATVATIDAEDLARAFAGSTQAAYSAVMKPREGTILTISRAMSDRAASFCKSDNPDRDDIVKLLDAVLEHGRKVLRQTPNMLPELKAAGVVDAGGEGLLTIWEGVRQSLLISGDIELNEDSGTSSPYASATYTQAADINFTYCTEFFISFDEAFAKPNLEASIMSHLARHGDSVVVVRDEGLVKVHVHTNHPGNVLEYALTIGSLSTIKIDNMREQNHEMASFMPSSPSVSPSGALAPQEVPHTGDIGFISVSSGEGFAEIFTKLGVNHIIEGGQTMNPSTDDILHAAQSIPAPDIFVLPNNKNIILAAKQAADLITGKTLHVLHTTSVPQGIAAMVAYVPGVSTEDNLSQMKDSCEAVTTGQVTYAVRDTELNGRTISQGDILGIVEGDIVASAKTVNECAAGVLRRLIENKPDLISIYVGQDIREGEAEALLESFRADYPDVDYEFHSGGQPLYYYIISAE